MTERFVGPIPISKVPKQPTWSVPNCMNWGAYDVPRIWDMVEHEGNPTAWEQVHGFTFLADFLEDQYRVWRIQRDQVAGAWQSPAADQFLKVLDQYGEDLLSDASSARQTSIAWNQTVEALGNARSQIEVLKNQWDEATSKYGHDAWVDTADRLNRQARRIMVETDEAVADARPRITSPRELESWFAGTTTVIDDKSKPPARVGASAGDVTAVARRTNVPPVPGFEPLVGVQTTPVLATSGEPQLPPGLPRLVPPVPGTPVSMLPIPPGNLYAPFGGAYILPGPGVGRGGYVVPMPQPPGTGPMAGPRALLPPGATGPGGTGGGVAGGMMPMPMATGPGGTGGHGALYRRPTIAWQVDRGVPPVIKVDPDQFVPDQPSPKQEAEFRDWFTDLAYPWRAEFKNSEGAQVTIRTVQ